MIVKNFGNHFYSFPGFCWYQNDTFGVQYNQLIFLDKYIFDQLFRKLYNRCVFCLFVKYWKRFSISSSTELCEWTHIVQIKSMSK